MEIQSCIAKRFINLESHKSTKNAHRFESSPSEHVPSRHFYVNWCMHDETFSGRWFRNNEVDSSLICVENILFFFRDAPFVLSEKLPIALLGLNRAG